MPKHPVRFGIQTGQQNVTWPELEEIWRKAEAWGYDSMWAYDHFYAIFTDPSGPCFEAWTTLAALAKDTNRVRIGHLVNGNTYRNPCMLAKMVTTVDHIAGGRTILGIGAGWFEPEHTSFGIPFRTVRDRLDALDESCRIVKALLAGETVTFESRHYSVKEAICRPLPVQKKIPIMIAGEGRNVLLRIVARHADMWNAVGAPEKMGELGSIIARHCEKERRDPSEIEKTVMLPLCYTTDEDRQSMMAGLLGATFNVDPAVARRQMMIGSRDECLEKIDAFASAGVTHFIFMGMAPYPVDELQAFAEDVMPAAREAHPGDRE
jgi:F420-dependent oxidoreductase-like protein